MPIVSYKKQQWFEFRHLVCFKETNLVGNVYYSNHLEWQGRCREMFLLECCPDVLALFSEQLAMVTLKVNCEYHHELFAFDDVAIRMRVDWQRQNRIALTFHYVRGDGGSEKLIAQGQQQLACLAKVGDTHEPRAFPEAMLRAIVRHGLAAGTSDWGLAV